MNVQQQWLDTESARDAAEADLRAWDWRAALTDQERTIPWLARKTNRAQTTVYRYAYGTLTPPLSWLQSAAAVLGRGAAS